jgi:hypothetical protein
MDQPAFRRRVDSGGCKYEKLMGNICGEEWAGSLDKIIGGRSNVYARYFISHLTLTFPSTQFNKGVQNQIESFQ